MNSSRAERIERPIAAPLRLWTSQAIGAVRGIVSNWKLKAALAITLIVLFRAFPAYEALTSTFVESKWRDAQVKFDHPLADMSVRFAPGSHESNLSFRLTIPVLAYLFHLQRNGLLVLFGVFGVAIFYLFLAICETSGATRMLGMLSAISIGCAWPGLAAFHELRGGYYDAAALFALLVAASSPSAVMITLSLFLAFCTDERCILVCLFTVLVPSRGGGRLVASRSRIYAVLVAGGTYLLLRLLMVSSQGYPLIVQGVGISVLRQQLATMGIAIWSGLAGAWVIVMFGLVSLVRHKHQDALISYAGVLGVSVLTSLLVVDTTRSVSYCLLAVFPAVVAIGRHRHGEFVAALAAIISVAVPTFYVEGNGIWELHGLPVILGHGFR